MKDKSIKITVKFQRTRILDCTRLMFPPGVKPGWYGLWDFPEVQPVYEIPKEVISGVYKIEIPEIKKILTLDTTRMTTYNDIVAYICNFLRHEVDSRNLYLYGIVFKKDRTATLMIDYIEKNVWEG